MNFDLILVFAVILFILVSLYWELLGPSFTFMVGIAILGFFGVLTPSEILSGFANEQIAVILLLLVFGEIIKNTGVVEVLFDKIFRGAKTYRGFLSRMTILISSFSAFLNNTPLVALMMPYVHTWCKKSKISPSKFLMPLSYAAILGGCATLIGTSTNLIVNGMVVDQQIIPGLKSLNIFDFAWVGIPMMIIGFFYLLFLGDRLLPNISKDIQSDFNANTREYLIEAIVREDSHLIGKTIQEAELRNLTDLFLVEIIRGYFKIPAIGPDVVLEAGDILVFAGDTEKIADLLNSKSGLNLAEVGMLKKKKKTEIVEVVVSQNSSIINKMVKDINFRSKYGAAIIAVHRNGEKIRGKIGEVVLKAGDVLLVFTTDEFVSRAGDSQDFYFISRVKEFVKLEPYKLVVLLGGVLLAIILSSFKIVSLFMGLLVVLLACLALKITTPKELPKTVDYNLALIIVMSLALGVAMIKSGAADLIANSFISVFLPLGKVGLLFGIYFVTSILAAYITTKAAVAIIFPISLTMALNLNLNPMPFILIVAYASAANFMTPIGFQTNLMVYGPGGYSFKDFFRVGFPLTIIYMVVTVFILNYVFL
ncbi:MAG: SLC13 family permease [Bacteroidales bacterium]|nr:SLC13 family permease [Bacteroidales bacterium]